MRERCVPGALPPPLFRAPGYEATFLLEIKQKAGWLVGMYLLHMLGIIMSYHGQLSENHELSYLGQSGEPLGR